ncbi:MAG: 2,3-bisphosphoglycerate-independent phosphoglycerate mutase [Chloroflexota bacterium]
MDSYRPVALIILDGWGIREMEHGNAVAQAHTPNYNRWLKTGERSILDASGEAVGLPQDQMGNSEVGHLNLGGGRIIYQDLTRVDKAIRDGSFYQNGVLLDALQQAKTNGGKLHLIGLFGPGGVHSHVRHLHGILRLARREGILPILHLITDGRDTPPRSAIDFLADLEQFMQTEAPAVIATVSGRYYAMDRDKRWPRTQRAYETIVQREGLRASSAAQAIRQSYEKDVTDEFIEPTVIEGQAGGLSVGVEPGDCLLFYNFRADRMRQIVKALALPDFDGFTRPFIEGVNVVTFTAYEAGLPVQVVFPDVDIVNPLAEVISQHNLPQFHAAETEKYAHVTYFFNGGREQPFPGEDRLLVPSPKVATYDLQPEMSAYQLAQAVEERIRTHDDAFILVNFANPDMVGHTGVLAAAIKAVEAVDECASRLVQAVTGKGGVALVTADHGNAERMIDELTGGPHTYHTTSPVSFFVIGDHYFALHPRGILADVAPTVLELMGLPQPAEMDGRSLIKHDGS